MKRKSMLPTPEDLTLDGIQARFGTDEAARAYLEEIRWPNGVVCPHCKNAKGDHIWEIKPNEAAKIRAGLYQCAECKKQFTVTVGTIFERSHVKLHKWFQAAHLMASSKKGISAHQLHRTLKVQYKTAWFMEHRLREAMRELNPTEPLGGEGKTVEMDETFIGGLEKNKHRSKRQHKGTGGVGKEAVYALVERRVACAPITFQLSQRTI